MNRLIVARRYVLLLASVTLVPLSWVAGQRATSAQSALYGSGSLDLRYWNAWWFWNAIFLWIGTFYASILIVLAGTTNQRYKRVCRVLTIVTVSTAGIVTVGGAVLWAVARPAT